MLLFDIPKGGTPKKERIKKTKKPLLLYEFKFYYLHDRSKEIPAELRCQNDIEFIHKFKSIYKNAVLFEAVKTTIKGEKEKII